MPTGRILKAVPGHWDGLVAAPCDYATRGALMPLHVAVQRFWSHMTLVGRSIRHRQLASGLVGYLLILDRALLIFSHWGKVTPPESRRVFDLEPEVDDLLAGSIQLERVSPETLAREYLRLARLVQRYAPRICDEQGVAYPVDLEAAVMRRLERDLAELGVSVPGSAPEC